MLCGEEWGHKTNMSYGYDVKGKVLIDVVHLKSWKLWIFLKYQKQAGINDLDKYEI